MYNVETINYKFLKWLAVECPADRTQILTSISEHLGYGICGVEHAYDDIVGIESPHIMDYFQRGLRSLQVRVLFDGFLESQN